MRLFVPWMLAATIAALPVGGGRGVTPTRAHPDFSGTWTLDPAKSEGPMIPTSATLKITQDEKSMKIERTVTMMGATQSRTSNYALDGSPSKNTISGNGQSVDFNSTAAWSDNVLVIKTTGDMGGNPFTGTDRYSLSDDKKTMVIAGELSIGGQSVNTKQTFVKQ
jgi:hypothetical protein